MSPPVFVGGGDAMLLHEILKYPQVELVLGLELDQKVTLHSFQHFKTRPLFDEWFGDGARSLTVLPRDYFGTFDLVLLDLSCWPPGGCWPRTTTGTSRSWPRCVGRGRGGGRRASHGGLT